MSCHSNPRTEGGGVLIEAALSLAFLLLVSDGILTFGTSFIRLGDLVGAAQTGSRVAASYVVSEDNPYAREELGNITRQAVGAYLQNAGYAPEDFLVELKLAQKTYLDDSDTFRVMKVAVMHRGAGSLFRKLLSQKQCATSYFELQHIDISALSDDFAFGDTTPCL